MASIMSTSAFEPIFRRKIEDHTPVPQVYPPCPYEKITTFAADTLEEYNGETYDRVRIPLRIEALLSHRHQLLRPQNEDDCLEYVLVRHSLCVRLQLRAQWSRHFRRVSVFVRRQDSWDDFGEWLRKNIPEPSPLGFAEQDTLDIWARSGKHFRFLDLPIEIQTMILDYALGPQVLQPVANACPQAKTLLPPERLRVSGSLRDHQDPTKTTFPSPNTSLFLVNRAIGQLAREIFCHQTIKVCRRTRAMQLISRLPQRFYLRLTRLELHFDNLEFAQYFQVPHLEVDGHFSGFADPCPTFKVQHFASLKALQHLNLHFQSTIGNKGNFWYRVVRKNERSTTKYCQRRLHEYMLPFIASHLLELHASRSRLKRIGISGYIKTDLKKRWTEILNDKSGTNKEDVEAMKQASIPKLITDGFAVPYLWDSVPQCECPLPCWSSNSRISPKHKDLAREVALGESYVYDFDDSTPRPQQHEKPQPKDLENASL